jgi:asparagine synthase (glutamine-hydrolysing)
MCGIFGILKCTDYDTKTFEKLNSRGPEVTNLSRYDENFLGFHRLAINGLDDNSNQPLYIDGIAMICNGEIYNYSLLYEDLEVTPTTHSDCEVIIHMYKRYGIEETVKRLDGVFAFVLYDRNKHVVHVARDPFGVRPLYKGNLREMWGFASEMKYFPNFNNITQFTPGTYETYKGGIFMGGKQYHYMTKKEDVSIKLALDEAVRKRVEGTTDRPIACLLSGGLDSSLVTGLVCKYYTGTLETYSIGMEGGEDLKYAKMVADYLGTKHTEIVVTEEDFLKAIPEVIEAIETYDTTTVRASVGNYLVAKYIKEHSDAKVIFNGDGADEVAGGYLYFRNIRDSNIFDMECRRLLKDIHMFDVQRSDRSISSNGLEPRTPFLDKDFVNAYMSIHPSNRHTLTEKYQLRKQFDGLIPKEVLWRKKEAFSDGVSSIKRSWFEIIEEFVTGIEISERDYLPPKTPEQMYYREIFEKRFGKKNCHLVPYFWMPRYSGNVTDCSARRLKVNHS